MVLLNLDLAIWIWFSINPLRVVFMAAGGWVVSTAAVLVALVLNWSSLASSLSGVCLVFLDGFFSWLFFWIVEVCRSQYFRICIYRARGGFEDGFIFVSILCDWTRTLWLERVLMPDVGFHRGLYRYVNRVVLTVDSFATLRCEGLHNTLFLPSGFTPLRGFAV
jgi:hypothetical protein